MVVIVVSKARAAWSAQRSCWRLDIQFVNHEGEPKRTFIVVPGAGDKSNGEALAKRAAKEFGRGIGTLYAGFMAKLDENRPAPKPRPLPSPMRRKGAVPTIDWLLDQCLSHPEVWGNVKHSSNYISGAKKLASIVGERLVSEFEPPHGRAIVLDVVNRLRSDGYSDGYVRKITYQLRQALSATIGEGVTEAIVSPEDGGPLLNDVPRFPSLPKSKGRTAILDRDHDQIVFAVINARRDKAIQEERAYAKHVGREHELGEGAEGWVPLANGAGVWLNPKRFTSRQWGDFAAYVRFLMETGCRRSEALSVGNHSVRWREVTGEDGEVVDRFPVIHLPGEVTKNGQDRFINCSPTLREKIALWSACASRHSFKIGDRLIEREKAWFPLTANQVTNMWEHVRTDAKAAHAVDLSKVSPHQLRHTFATRMSERGLHGKGLSDTLGHTDERTTRIYDHAQSVDQSRRFFARDVSAGAGR